MVSVEYLKSTARLKESIFNCESERLNLEQRLQAMKTSDPPDSGGAMSSYYRDLCQREASMQRRAEVILRELDKSEASYRNLSRRVEQLRARRNQIISERAPEWRDEVIDFLRRRTSQPTSAAGTPTATVSLGGTAGTGPVGNAARLSATGAAESSSAVPPLNFSQLSRTSGAGSTAAAGGGNGGGGGGGGGGWNTSGALLGLTESTMDSTAMSRYGQTPQEKQQQPHSKTSALDEDDDDQARLQANSAGGGLSSRRSQDDQTATSLGSSRAVSDLTVSGLVKLLDFIDSEMERAQPRALSAYYASSPPSDTVRQELCRAANGPGGLPSHVSAVAATCLVLEELEFVVSTRLPAGFVFPDRMVASLSAVRDPSQLERQIDMNLTDEARSLWCRLLGHMRRLAKRTGRSGADVARLFCPALLHHRSAQGSGAQLVEVVARILDLPATRRDDSVDGGDDGDDDDDEESVTIASDKLAAASSSMRPKSQPPVGESMQATAGSFVDEESSGSEPEQRLADAKMVGRDSLNVTGNPELRASQSDAHVRAYAAALADDSADDSSVTELTQQSGTNRSGFFSHNSPQPNLKG